MNFQERISVSYSCCLEDDDGESRSLHWQKRREEELPEHWLEGSRLESFRSSSDQLSSGMDNAGLLSEAVAAYKSLPKENPSFLKLQYHRMRIFFIRLRLFFGSDF